MWLGEMLKKSSNTSKKSTQISWLGYLYAKLTGVGLNLCEHAEKAESYPGRWVLSHSSLVKNVTFGSKFVDVALWPSGEWEKVYL